MGKVNGYASSSPACPFSRLSAELDDEDAAAACCPGALMPSHAIGRARAVLGHQGRGGGSPVPPHGAGCRRIRSLRAAMSTSRTCLRLWFSPNVATDILR